MFCIFTGSATLKEAAGHLNYMMKSIISLTNMCECGVVTSVSMLDVSSSPCINYQEYKCCRSQAFCHPGEEVRQHLAFFIQRGLSSEVTHGYNFKKGISPVLHWAGLEKSQGQQGHKKATLLLAVTQMCDNTLINWNRSLWLVVFNACTCT